MFQTVPILLGWLLTVSTCYAAGFLLLRMAQVDLFQEEQHFFRFVTGSACVSLVIFALTSAHLAYRDIFIAFGVVVLANTAIISRKQAVPASRLPDFPVIWKLMFGAILCVYGVVYFAHALGPESSPDGATYHLGLVDRYLRQHRFGHITTNMYANLSEGIELLFLMAYSVGRHSAASLVEFSFLLALPWGMLSYARRIGNAPAGVFGAIVVFVSPVFGYSGTVAYNDTAGVCLLFALFYLLQIWAETRQFRLIPLIGVVAGFCYGAKYTLFLALPFAGLFLLWHLWRSRLAVFRPLLTYSACALAFVVPWMVKNWITVRNPFSPFANSLFPNHFITIHFEQQYSALMRHPKGLEFWDRPLEHIVHGGISSGLLGPIFLLAPLAILALRYRAGRQLLLATAVFILPAYTNIETRFLMPMAPFLALSLGLVCAAVPAGIPVLLLFHVMTSWPTAITSYSGPYVWHLPAFRAAESLRLVPEKTTLLKYMPDYAVSELLERVTPANARIFTFDNIPEAYTSRETILMYESAFGNRLGEMLWTAIIPERQPTESASFDFRARQIQKFRLMQLAADPAEMWSISEIRVMSGEVELARESNWRMRASVNRWDAPFAFDNNPVTQWSTMQPIESGMFMEVDLGRPRTVSSVIVEAAPQQRTRLRLELQRDPKTWVALSTTPEIQTRRLRSNLRADAVAELKFHGMTHLMLGPVAFGRDDFAMKHEEWGIELIGEARGFRIYKLL